MTRFDGLRARIKAMRAVRGDASALGYDVDLALLCVDLAEEARDYVGTDADRRDPSALTELVEQLEKELES